MHADSPRTIRALIAATTPWLAKRGSASARLDTELLIGHALGMKRLDLYLDIDKPLSDDELTACRALVKRRGTGEPVAYIVGHREFYGIRIGVSPAVLIPRADTERLVELALQRIPQDADGVVVDVCTGSGCVALALLANRPNLTVIATDISGTALAVARANAEALQLADRLTLLEGDLLAPCAGTTDVLLVVSNPPYVLRDSPLLGPGVAEFEPALALYGESDDGLGHHRRIIAAAVPMLVDNGAVMLEIGADQGEAARTTLGADLLINVTIERDLDDHDRVVVLQR